MELKALNFLTPHNDGYLPISRDVGPGRWVAST